MAWLFLKSAAKGSQTLVHAALDPELENISGQFISNFKIIPLPFRARDQKTVEWLWKVSEKWTKVKENVSPEL